MVSQKPKYCKSLERNSHWRIPGADLAFFQGGGGVWPIVHEPRSGEPIFFCAILRAAKRRADFFFGYFTSREAASRFFWLFYEPRSGEPIFLAIWRAAKRRADFFGLFLTPVSDVFLASTNAMETMITSLAAQGGGGGVKPYCLRLSLRQSAIGTYCVGLDILWWRFSMHIKFLLGSPRGGGGLNPLNPPPPRSPTEYDLW